MTVLALLLTLAAIDAALIGFLVFLFAKLAFRQSGYREGGE